MRSRVTNDFDTIDIAISNYCKLYIAIDDKTGIDKLAIDFARQRSLGEASADTCGHFCNRDGVGKIATTTVGEGYCRHGGFLNPMVAATKGHLKKQKMNIVQRTRQRAAHFIIRMALCKPITLKPKRFPRKNGGFVL